jgi:hypothetical protein
METKILDSELPLEENFYEHGHNICEAKELSFMKIEFYNVPKSNQEFILGILKQFNFNAGNPIKFSDKVNSVIVNI